MLARLATLAHVRVDHRPKHGEAGEETQGRADGADGVAPGTSVLPRQDDDYHKGDGGYDERGQAPQPDFLGIESVAVGSFRQGGEQIVDPDINRLEQVLDDAAPRAVRGQQGYERLHARNEGDDEQNPHAVAEPFDFGAVAIRLAILLPAFARYVEMRHAVLKHAQRADDGAIDASENEGQQDKADDDGDIDGQHGRQELDLRHPTEPSMQRPGEVQEQQRDAQPKEDGQCHADFFEHKSLFWLQGQR